MVLESRTSFRKCANPTILDVGHHCNAQVNEFAVTSWSMCRLCYFDLPGNIECISQVRITKRRVVVEADRRGVAWNLNLSPVLQSLLDFDLEP